MEFKQAMRIFNRICKEREMCDGCVLENKCIVLKECDYSTAEAILAKWAAKHPEKTIADDFFEKFPNALRDDNGCPTTCARRLGYVCECLIAEDKASDCVACWRRPLEEEAHHD